MQVERVEEMRLTADDEEQINHLLLAAFDDGFGDRSFYQQRHHLRLVVRHMGIIVGHMGLGYRAIRLGQNRVNIVGLGDVATHPEHQGQGIAGALLTSAVQEVAQTQAAFFILFGNRPIYAGRGFQAKQNAVTYVEMTSAHTGAVTTSHDTDLMIMQIDDISWDDDAVVDLLGHNF